MYAEQQQQQQQQQQRRRRCLSLAPDDVLGGATVRAYDAREHRHGSQKRTTSRDEI